MLPKDNRLDKESYKAIFEKGKSHHSPLLMVKYVLIEQGKPRFSAIVSKKIYSKAHDRNSVRRFIYNTIAENLTPSTQVSAIFVLKKQYLTSTKEDLKKQIAEVLETISN